MSVSSLADRVKSRFPAYVADAYDNRGDQTVVLKKEGVREVIGVLRDDPDFKFNFLMDLAGVDYLFWEEKEFRFEVIYNLFSTTHNHRLFIKALVPENDCAVDSIVSVYPAADWYEREVWDMFGIQFKGHPNLKRILMYEGFKGHALRKDYPYDKRQPLVGPDH